jgi:hypothetical protein
MGLDGRDDFLQGKQICKASNFRWKVPSKAWIANYGSANSKKRKTIPLAQADLKIKCTVMAQGGAFSKEGA